MAISFLFYAYLRSNLGIKAINSSSYEDNFDDLILDGSVDVRRVDSTGSDGLKNCIYSRQADVIINVSVGHSHFNGNYFYIEKETKNSSIIREGSLIAKFMRL